MSSNDHIGGLVTATPRTYSITCPACRDVLISAPVAPCGVCGIPHHADCLIEIGCASLNCHPIGDADADADDADDAENPLARWIEETDLASLGLGRGDDGDDGDDGGDRLYLNAHETGGAYDRCQYSAAWHAEFLASSEDDARICTVARNSGMHGAYFSVADTPCGCRGPEEDTWACEEGAVRFLQRLEDDGRYEIETWPIEQRWIGEEWEERARDEFLDALAEKAATSLGLSQGDLSQGDLSDAQLDALRDHAIEGSGHYAEVSGQVLFPLSEWAEWVFGSPEHKDIVLGGLCRDDLLCDRPRALKLSWHEESVTREIVARTLRTAAEFGMSGQVTGRLIAREILAEMSDYGRKKPENVWRRRLIVGVAWEFAQEQQRQQQGQV